MVGTVVVSGSREETIAIGKKIGSKAVSGDVLLLYGDLGAGKTTLCKGIALGLGIHETVTSPTYTIINVYSGRLEFVHMDAYRLSGAAEFYETGGAEMLGTQGSFCVLEWSERLPDLEASGYAKLKIEVLRDGTRSLTVSGKWLEGLFQ